MKIREIIDTFFFPRIFWEMDIRVRFGSREERYQGTRKLVEKRGEETCNKVEFGESGMVFYVSENDEDW